MKTLTEFDGFKLKNALKIRNDLTAGGKTAEELPAAMGEALKLEGDKLTLFLAALDIAASAPDNIKRVVVSTLAEGEKAPGKAVEKDGKIFTSEFFFVPSPKREAKQGRDHGKGDRGKKGRHGKGRGKGRDHDNRRPRKDAATSTAEGPKDASPAPAPTSGDPSENKKRRRPRFRPQKPKVPFTGEPPVKPLATPVNNPNPVAQPNEAPAETKSES